MGIISELARIAFLTISSRNKTVAIFSPSLEGPKYIYPRTMIGALAAGVPGRLRRNAIVTLAFSGGRPISSNAFAAGTIAEAGKISECNQILLFFILRLEIGYIAIIIAIIIPSPWPMP